MLPTFEIVIIFIPEKAIFCVQSSTVISVDISANMQHVVCSLVIDEEDPVFSREPVVSHRLLPFQAQTVVARCRQEMKPL